MTNEQAQMIAGVAVALHRTRRELAEHERNGATKAARPLRVEVGRLETELSAAIETVAP